MIILISSLTFHDLPYVHHTNINPYISSSYGGSGKLHLMDGENSDSGLRAVPAAFAGDSEFHERGTCYRFYVRITIIANLSITSFCIFVQY